MASTTITVEQMYTPDDGLSGSDFLRSTRGLILLVQTICSIVGGVVNVYSGGVARGLFSFLFWSTTCISGSLLLMYTLNGGNLIRSRFPIFPRLELFYVAIWTLLYVVSVALSLLGLGMSTIFAVVILGSFGYDVFLRYNAYRTHSPPDATAAPKTGRPGDLG